MPTDHDALKGLRVLVVEDSLLVAEMITDLLEEAGVSVVGPASRVDRALAVAEDAVLDGALLDVNLAGQWSFPVAEMLRERGIPFIFLTGYSDAGALPPAFRSAPRVLKPFRASELSAAMAAGFRRTAPVAASVQH